MICGLVPGVLPCPSGCSCAVEEYQCSGVDGNTIFYMNLMVTKLTFEDSTVDVMKIVQAFPNIQNVKLENSQTVNCRTDLIVGIRGLYCTEKNDNDNVVTDTGAEIEVTLSHLTTLSEGSLGLSILALILMFAYYCFRFIIFMRREKRRNKVDLMELGTIQSRLRRGIVRPPRTDRQQHQPVKGATEQQVV